MQHNKWYNAALLSAYIALGSVNCRADPALSAPVAEGNYSLETKLNKLQLKNTDKGDIVQATIMFENNGKTGLTAFNWDYSICCTPPSDLNNTESCMGGGTGKTVDALNPGQSAERYVEARRLMGGGDIKCNPGLVPVFHIGVESFQYSRGYPLQR